MKVGIPLPLLNGTSTRSRDRVPLWLLALTALLLGSSSPNQAATARLAAQWEFNTPEAVAAWTPNGDIHLDVAQNGSLSGQAVGAGPILLGPPMNVPSSPFQWLEIRWKSDIAGRMDLFWANTTAEPYGGFRPRQLISMQVLGDSRFHTYRIFPLWRSGQPLLRLRIDPATGSHFSIEAVRLMDETPSPGRALHVPELRFEVDPTAASPVGPRGAMGTSNGWEIWPIDAVDAAKTPWLTLRARSHSIGPMKIGWLSSGADGLVSTAAELDDDNQAHTYNLAVGGDRGWQDQIIALARSGDPGADLISLTAATTPQGPANLVIRRALLWSVAPRAGKTAPAATVVADLANTGGLATGSLQVTLQAPSGLKVVGAARQSVTPLEPGDSQQLRWTVHADAPVTGTIQVTAKSPAGTLTRRTEIEIPAMRGRKAKVVPAPHPVASNYDVGVYYFPGWGTYSRWQVLNDFPERTPVLGYYREGDPEVADWQLKWMSEHAVRFIAYDWYWDRGVRSLTQGLEGAYLHSRFKKYVKFCLLWANHNPAGTSSTADLLAATRYWIDHYFKLPEYYTIDGKPVVIIFTPDRFTSDMGADAVRDAMNQMRVLCRQAGLPGLYLVACVSDQSDRLKTVTAEGYDATSGYNYPSLGLPAGAREAPYASMIPGYESIWNRIAQGSSLPYIPPTAPGWDNRPWAGSEAMVRTGSSPALMRKMLIAARAFADAHPIRTAQGPRKVALVEAWNEFGEGDYVEPTRGFGFGMLDAIRDVFGTGPIPPGESLVPADVGMGPYEFLPVAPVTSWIFNRLKDRQGWSPQNMTALDARADGLDSTAGTDDPAYIGPSMKAASDRYPRLLIEMSVDAGNDAQVFWASGAGGFSEGRSIHFRTVPDGKPHVYSLDPGESPAWLGNITQLRIDPSSVKGTHSRLIRVQLLTKGIAH